VFIFYKEQCENSTFTCVQKKVDSSYKPKILQQELQLKLNCLNFCIPAEFGVYSALERRDLFIGPGWSIPGGTNVCQHAGKYKGFA
jgi:hypothetical protein